jgi:rubredoxin
MSDENATPATRLQPIVVPLVCPECGADGDADVDTEEYCGIATMLCYVCGYFALLDSA